MFGNRCSSEALVAIDCGLYACVIVFYVDSKIRYAV